MVDDVAQIAEGLTKVDRQIAAALCGQNWKGFKPSPGLLRMNACGLMHLVVLKSDAGVTLHFKARPTDLGLAIYNHLTKEPHP